MSLVAACQDESADGGPRPSILVVTMDTARVDSVGAYGEDRGITPNLDALAAEGVRYQMARATSPITLPSHTSMFTGLYPPRHAVRDNGLIALSQEATTTAEVAEDAGYQTAAFIAALVLDRSYGLDQGFQTYDEPPRQLKILRSRMGFFAERPAHELTPKIEAWLDARDRDKPFFLWAHFYDPHQPYAPAPEFLEQANGHAYLGEVAAVDAAIGSIVDKLRSDGSLDSTLIVVLSDHGEDFEQHGEPTHGLLIYDTTMRVPFIVRHPDGRGAGTVVEQAISVADLHPTLVDAMGRKVPEGLDGQSLLQPLAQDRGIYFESYGGFYNFGWRPLAGWAAGKDKTIFSSRVQLFDVLADPGELHDVWTPAATLPNVHRKQIASVYERPALEPDLDAVDPDQLAALEALGYAAVGFTPEEVPAPFDESDLPDPHDSMPEFELVQRGIDLGREGRVDEAATLLDSVVKSNPRNFRAMQWLVGSLTSAERYSDARYWGKQLLDAGSARPEDVANLAFACEKLGDLRDAEKYYRQALAVRETNLSAVRGLVRLTKNDPDKREEHEALKARARELRGLEPEE